MAIEALYAQQRGLAVLYARHAGVVGHGASPAMTRAGFDALLVAHEIFAAPWAEVRICFAVFVPFAALTLSRYSPP